jgi:CRISPR-associated protein Cas2
LLYLISYDIEDDTKRGKISNHLKDYGNRVQYSVFELEINAEDYNNMIEKLLVLFNRNVEKNDSLRIYKLCSGCVEKIKFYGTSINDRFKNEIVII